MEEVGGEEEEEQWNGKKRMVADEGKRDPTNVRGIAKDSRLESVKNGWNGHPSWGVREIIAPILKPRLFELSKNKPQKI